MIHIASEMAAGVRLVSLDTIRVDDYHVGIVGEFREDNGICLFYPRKDMAFTPELLTAVANLLQKENP